MRVLNFSRAEKILFLGAVGVRAALLSALIFYFGGDYIANFPGSGRGLYTFAAENLSGILSFDSGYRMPGYALFIWIFNVLHLPLWLAVIVQIVLVSLLPVLAMRMARFSGLGERSEYVAGILTAFEPLQVFYSVQLMPDMLTAFLFFAGIYMLLCFWRDQRMRQLIWSAVLMGLSNYLQPRIVHFWFLLPLLLIFFYARSARLSLDSVKYAIIFGAVFFLILSPWMIVNYGRHGVFGFGAGAAPYLYYGTGSGIIAARDRISFEEAYQKLDDAIYPYLPEQRGGLHDDSRWGIRNAAIEQEMGLKIVRENLGVFSRLYIFAVQTYFISGNYHYVLKELGLINPPSQGQVSLTKLFASGGIKAVVSRLLVFLPETYGMVALLGRMFLGVIFLASFAGVYGAYRYGTGSGKGMAALYILCLAYGALSVVAQAEGAEPRQRLWLNSLIFVFAAGGLSIWYEFLKERIGFRRNLPA